MTHHRIDSSGLRWIDGDSTALDVRFVVASEMRRLANPVFKQILLIIFAS